MTLYRIPPLTWQQVNADTHKARTVLGIIWVDAFPDKVEWTAFGASGEHSACGKVASVAAAKEEAEAHYRRVMSAQLEPASLSEIIDTADAMTKREPETA